MALTKSEIVLLTKIGRVQAHLEGVQKLHDRGMHAMSCNYTMDPEGLGRCNCGREEMRLAIERVRRELEVKE